MEDEDEIIDPMTKILPKKCGKCRENAAFFLLLVPHFERDPLVQLSSFLLIRLLLHLLDLQNILVNLEVKNLIFKNLNY